MEYEEGDGVIIVVGARFGGSRRVGKVMERSALRCAFAGAMTLG